MKVDQGNLGRSQTGVVKYRISFNYESKESEVLERVEPKPRREKYSGWEYVREEKIHIKLLNPSAGPVGEWFGRLVNLLGQFNMKLEDQHLALLCILGDSCNNTDNTD